jgi:hypothetical protein
MFAHHLRNRQALANFVQERIGKAHVCYLGAHSAQVISREFSTAMPKAKMPVAVLLALTAGPALAIGVTLWVVNDMVPACVVTEAERLTAPDGEYDLVTFSRACGETPPNIQAALVPPGEEVPFDAASFVSVVEATELTPRWIADGQIEITLPQTGEVLRQDETVADIPVVYR